MNNNLENYYVCLKRINVCLWEIVAFAQSYHPFNQKQKRQSNHNIFTEFKFYFK